MSITLNIDRILFRLLCLYAFFIPLEKIFEVFLGLETIFKPYRIIALLVIFLFGLRTFYRWDSNKDLSRDMFFYFIFIYGLILSLVRVMVSQFHTGYFFNDLIQLGIYLAIFIIIHQLDLTRNQIIKIFTFLCAGIITNAAYIFYSFFISRKFVREAGMMDNPNYLAFAVVLVILFLINRGAKGIFGRLVWIALLLFLGYILVISGSRMALIVLVICSLGYLAFSRFREKMALIIIVTFFCVGILYVNSINVLERGPLFLLNRLKVEKTTGDVRFDVWSGAMDASAKSNFLGLGIGQFKARFHEFFHDENNELIQRMLSRGYYLAPHSDYVALLVTYGVPGLLAYLLFIFLVARKLLFKFWVSQKPDEKSYFKQIFLFFLAVCLFGLGADNFLSPVYWIVLTLSSKTSLIEA